ncbi:extracellular solute-binding protein family 3 [Methylocella silvestris BL2]|uniref:Extracellular solute-binding protein family 3 n=1 Tax=Methylocella silvestris (strain DSM 15510 / CIP 108128 / LMG 27833 / NCIMB 13906 / BL2) TaxID=395965 RepID=B8ES74_METSB|nr:substrate-binding domain-containing protein [Methylocella silvestris]ACK52289.1 extracellular solute-binding protein family 3 [Methylocella silvestris BL2]
MSSRFLRACMAGAALAAAPLSLQALELRVCADPNNLPFSDRSEAGFENKIAEVIASDIGAKLSYFWLAQRRGFLRKTLNAHVCDVVIGIPVDMHMLRTTKPYYRSGYVFVQPGDAPRVTGFDDPKLARLEIGVQLVGNDGVNTPPAHELADRGIVANVRGYMVYGDYGQPAPLRGIIDGLLSGQTDVAIMWGPEAGWFASQQDAPLRLTPVGAGAKLPMAFDIGMGVRKEDPKLAADLEAAIDRRRSEIEAILADYHVPLLPIPAQKAEAAP